jgi:hypothetical protein
LVYGLARNRRSPKRPLGRGSDAASTRTEAQWKKDAQPPYWRANVLRILNTMADEIRGLRTFYWTKSLDKYPLQE